MNPTFSIIIPAYNNIDLLKRAISSVLSQDYTAFEIVITDDSDYEYSTQITEEFDDKRIRYFSNNPSLGAPENWNKGIELSVGEYIILLHHDEKLFNKDFLTICESIFIDNKLDCIVALKRIIDGELIKISRTPSYLISKVINNIPSSIFLINYIGPTASFIVRRKKIESFDKSLKWLVDVDWYFRIMSKAGARFTDRISIESFHGHPGQITNNIDIKTTEKKDIEILKKKYKSVYSIRFILALRAIVQKIFANSKIRRRINPVWRKYEDS